MIVSWIAEAKYVDYHNIFNIDYPLLDEREVYRQACICLSGTKRNNRCNIKNLHHIVISNMLQSHESKEVFPI